MESQFKIGEIVKAKAFIDCFGISHKEERNLVIDRIQFIENLHPHVRVRAGHPGTLYWIEGNQNSFEKKEG